MIAEIGYAGIPVVIKNAGLDYCIIDFEHGAFDYCELRELIFSARSVGLNAVVRLPDNNRKDIIRLLDMGADGLLLPMSETAEQVRAVVGYAKYPPVGKRGVSTMRAHTGYNPGNLAQYMLKSNERITVYAQIETAKGVANLSEIVAVDNLNGIFVGPNDLSADLNCMGDNAPVLAAMQVIAKTVKAANKKLGVITSNPILLAEAERLAFDTLCISSELAVLAAGYKSLRR
jgi:2-dehydro-3-deoxyglucarate aldolase/4-hydroxy-2-oxoheptanedioate aldolase